MDEANRSRMSTVELLGTTWQVWRSHAGMFVLLMGIPIATLGLFALIVNYVIAPHPEGIPLREVWLGMGFLQKLAVFVAFLGSLAMQYRALAASGFATPGNPQRTKCGNLAGLRIGSAQAVATFLDGDAGDLAHRAAGIGSGSNPCFWHCACFSGGDTRKYDGLCGDQTRRYASQRGTRKDSVVGFVVAGAGNRGGVRLGVVSSDARRAIRPTVVSPASSDSGLLAYIADPTVVHDCAYSELLGATRPGRRN